MPTLRQVDPSRTAGLARLYAAEIARRFAALDKAIRISIIDNDALGLTNSVLLFNDAITPASPRQWSSPSQLKAFQQWLEDALAKMIDDHGDGTPQWIRTYVRAAYARGVDNATRFLARANGTRGSIERTTEQVLSIPFHRERLEALFERNFTELKGISEAMSTKIQRALADGLLAGEGPKAIARRISDEIGISKRRARVIARTEVIRTNAEAQLNTFERFGIAEVEVEAEWITAEDGRVCFACSQKSGKHFTIEQARGMIPLHPSCRCSWLAVTKSKEAAA